MELQGNFSWRFPVTWANLIPILSSGLGNFIICPTLHVVDLQALIEWRLDAIVFFLYFFMIALPCVWRLGWANHIPWTPQCLSHGTVGPRGMWWFFCWRHPAWVHRSWRVTSIRALRLGSSNNNNNNNNRKLTSTNLHYTWPDFCFLIRWTWIRGDHFWAISGKIPGIFVQSSLGYPAKWETCGSKDRLTWNDWLSTCDHVSRKA